MKQNETKTRRLSRFSRRDALPLLRGMFVYPESLKRLRNMKPSDPLRFMADDDKAIVGI